MVSHQLSAISCQPKQFLLLLIAESCVLIALSGCATLTVPQQAGRLAASFHQPSTTTGYDDYVGVIHVHTGDYSHDAHGTFKRVVRVANAQHLDYVIMTEHNNLQALRDGLEGWHGAVLILIGMEISAPDGHYLAFNIAEEFDRHSLTTQEVIDEVNRQGGFGFIAHPYFKKGRWTNWSVTGFTGIEAYNVSHDALDENRLRLVLWTLTAPADPFYFSILDRPYDPLAKWDVLNRSHDRVVGIGSTDAHEFHLLGFKFAPYEALFQLSRTHLLIPTGEELTDQAIYDALRSGHVYFSIEWLAEAKGFQFTVEQGTRLLGIMGDEIVWEPDLHLNISLPTAAQLALYRDGQQIAETTAQSWRVPVTHPGVYRVEATRHEKPWIFSNPIYIRAAIEAPEEQEK